MIHSFKTKVNRFIPQKTYRNSLKYICSVTVYAINVVNLKLIYLLPCNRSDDLRFSYKMLPQNHSLKTRKISQFENKKFPIFRNVAQFHSQY